MDNNNLFNFLQTTIRTVINSTTANNYEPPISVLKHLIPSMNNLNFQNESLPSNINDYKFSKKIYESDRIQIFELRNEKESPKSCLVLKRLIEEKVHLHLCSEQEIQEQQNAKQAFFRELELLQKLKRIDDNNHFCMIVGYKIGCSLFGFNFYDIFIERGFCSLNEMLKFRWKGQNFYKESELAWILEQILDALVFLEENGIAHCDLKPHNIILVTKEINGKIKTFYKISDFGISLPMGHYSEIESTNIKGFTKKYASKEIKKAVESHVPISINPFLADVYSLGIVVLEMMGIKLEKARIIARGKKELSLKIRRKYPEISRMALEMVDSIKKRPKFSYFKDQIKEMKNKTDPNDHDLNFEKMRNLEKLENHNRCCNHFDDIIRKEKNYTHFDWNPHIKKPETAEMQEKIKKIWRKVVERGLSFLVMIRILSKEEGDTKMKAIFDCEFQILDALELKKKGRILEAKASMELALYQCEKSLGSFFNNTFALIFLMFCYRKLGRFDLLLKIIISEKFMMRMPNVLPNVFLFSSSFPIEIFNSVSFIGLKGFNFELYNMSIPFLNNTYFELYNSFTMKVNFIFRENPHAFKALLKTTDPIGFYLKNDEEVVEFTRYMSEAKNLLFEAMNNSKFARVLNEGLHLLKRQKLRKRSLNFFLKFLKEMSNDREDGPSYDFNDLTFILKGEIYIACGEIYKRKNKLYTAKRFFKKGYNLVLLYFKRFWGEGSHFLASYNVRIQQILLILGKIRSIKDPIGKDEWDKLFLDFELLNENSKSLRLLKQTLELNNYSLRRFFPEIVFSFKKMRSLYKKKNNFRAALRIAENEIIMKKKLFGNFNFDENDLYFDLGNLKIMQEFRQFKDHVDNYDDLNEEIQEKKYINLHSFSEILMIFNHDILIKNIILPIL